MASLDTPAERAGAVGPVGPVAGSGRLGRTVGRLGRGELVALAVLVGLPVLVFGLPAALGHPVVPGDDLIQNEPLRALVGRQVRHGHLPLLDPYIWSGAPLLGGWNAGAAYPPTLLFTVLPVTLAWALNQMLVGWVAGLGTHVFLRQSGLRAAPAFLGAVTFSFGGAMVGQVPHFGLVAGMSWVPVMLLALLRLSRPAPVPARLGWSALFAAGAGLCVLAGEPRAIDTAVVVVALYALWRAVRLGRRAGPFLGWVGVATLVGIGLGAAQWLPGVTTVHASQRAAVTYDLFNAGSFNLRWLLLLLVPSVLGGSGSFGTPPFLASYNLTEVTGYVGLLPMAAAFALAARLRWRRPLPEWTVWLVVAAAGVVLALGGNTPAWHLLIHLPLYGGQRLQSRNILVADFALAVLLAYWLDEWLVAEARPAERVRAALRRAAPAVLPLVGAAVTVVLGLAWGPGFLRWLGVAGGPAGSARRLAPVIVPFLVVAVAAAGLVVLGRRLGPRRRAALTVLLVVVDLVALAATSVVEVAGGLGAAPASQAPAALPTAPGPTKSIASLHLPGRFAVFDPDLHHGTALNELGVPDLNVLDGTYSMQGYSSIVDGAYATATGSHQPSGAGQNVLSVAAVANGTLDELETSTLFTLPRYLVRLPASGQPTAAGAGTDIGAEPVAAGSRRTWYFGEPLDVASVQVVPRPIAPSTGATAASLRVGLVAVGGSVTWLVTRDTSTVPVAAAPARPRSAVGVVVAVGPGTGAIPVEPPTVTETSGQVVVADGPLQAALVPPHWTFVGNDGPFAVFRDHRARPAVVVRPLPGAPEPSSTATATVRAVAGPAVAPSSLAVSSPAGVEVVRSVAAIAGWKAVWTPNGGGPPRRLPVRRTGVVQAVDVPPGRGVLTFTYEPSGAHTGFALSLAAAAVVLAGLVLAWWLAGRRRSGRSQVPPSTG